MRKGVRSIGFEPGRLDVIYFGDFLPRYLARDCSYAGAHDRRLQCPASVSGDRLPGRNRLPRDAVQSSVFPLASSPLPPEAHPETLYSSTSAVPAASRSSANSLRLPTAPPPWSPCAWASSWP